MKRKSAFTFFNFVNSALCTHHLISILEAEKIRASLE